MHELELEASGLDEFDWVASEVAAIGESLFQRIKAALPGLRFRVGSEAMFEEMEPATGLEDAAEFGECLFDARNRAECERAERAVAGVVVKRDRFAIQAGVLDGNGRGSNSRHRNLACGECRLDGVDEFNLGWVTRNVQA